MKLKDIKIATQLRLGISLILVFLLVLGAMSYMQTSQFWQRTQMLHDHSLEARRALGDLRAAVLTVRIEFRNFILAQNEPQRRRALANRAAAMTEAGRQFDILNERFTEPAADIDQARQAFSRWTALQTDNERLVHAGKTAEVLSRTEETGDIGLARGQLMQQIGKIGEYSRHRADQIFGEARALKEKQLLQTLAIGLGALLIAMVISWRLIRNVKDPIAELNRAIEQFRRGEGEARSGYTSANEFGHLSDAFNEMARTMETQAQINDQAAQLAGVMLRESDAHSFCREALKAIMAHTGSQIGAVYLLNDQKTAFEHFDSIGLSADRRTSFSAGLREGEFGLALASGCMQRITKIPADTAFFLTAVSGELRPREIITLPLQASGETIAVISLAKVSKYEEQALRLLGVVSGTTAARMSGVLSYRQIQQLADRLEIQNRELEGQKQELVLQGAEMEALNRELEMQKRQLEEANRLKSTFLSNMSHELRTPLNSVLALSRALAIQAGKKLSPEEFGYLEIIERNGKNLLALINDLLDLAKIEAGRMDVRPAPFSLGQTLENVVQILAPLAGEKNIDLRLDVPEDLPVIESDEIRVTQILQNLIGNAVKFTEAGSVTVSAGSDGGRIFVRIADTGIGIAQEDLLHIFDEFRQVNGSPARRHEGTGLGLAIARKTARILGGDIAVESKLGEGSVFTLTLPLTWPGDASGQGPSLKVSLGPEPEPDRPAGRGAGATASSHRPRILLAEDNEAAVIQVKSVLESAGYLVDVARGGQEAHVFLSHTVPDAIVLDLMMPEEDGFAVLKKLRSAPATAAVPVLVLTAKDLDPDDLKRLKANQIQQLVQKGDVDREGLLSKIASLLKTR